jgi:hypothetical protein
MIIADLGYLEESSQSSILRGGLLSNDPIGQYNEVNVKQYASSYANAEAFRGNATAYADSTNRSAIYQSNTNYS